MNYLKQIKGFSLMRRLHPLSSGSIALYYLLLEEFNMVGFPRSMSIPLERLIAESGLGKTALCRARRELVEKGYLTLNKKKSPRSSAVYTIRVIDPKHFSNEIDESISPEETNEN